MYTDEPDLSHRDQLTYHHHIYQHETTTSLSPTPAASGLLRYSAARVLRMLNIHLKLCLKTACS